MRKYIAEFIGTFFLVLTVGCTVIPAAEGVIPALAIGAVLMVMIFAGGHISGGHFNPAVTFAVFIRGKLLMKDVVPYWLAQIAAGIAAALVAMFLVGKSGTPMEITNIPRLRRCQLRDRERHSGQQFLRTGYRFHGAGRHIRSRIDFRRRVQSSSRHRCGGDETRPFPRHLDSHCGPARGRPPRRSDFQISESDRYIATGVS